MQQEFATEREIEKFFLSYQLIKISNILFQSCPIIIMDRIHPFVNDACVHTSAATKSNHPRTSVWRSRARSPPRPSKESVEINESVSIEPRARVKCVIH